MVVGSVLGLTQTDLKRMLAYSSIAHAGFLLTGVIALGAGEGGAGGLSATMFYLLVYGLTDRKSTRLNSSHANISYAVFCLKKKKKSDSILVNNTNIYY